MVSRIPDDYWYAPYGGKYTAVGGTVICDSEREAIEFEKEHYKNDMDA